MSNGELVRMPDREVAPAEMATLYGTNDPEAITRKAVAIAEQAKGVIESKGLAQRIAGKTYVKAEGWQMIGGLIGLTATTEWTKPIPSTWDGKGRPYGWEARVILRTLDGRVAGTGDASCMRDEQRWEDADDYAVRSMAQTRALGKAYRLAVGYVATLAGYEATPAEEMPSTVDAPASASRGSQRPSGGSQGASDLSCPACGSKVYDNRPDIDSGKKAEKYPAFKCSNKSCTGHTPDGEKVTDSKKDDEPWVTWSRSFFDEASPTSLDTDELLEVQAHVDTGAITEGAVLAIARRVAKDHDEDQPTSLLEIDQLPEKVRVAVVEAVAEKIGGGE